MRNLKRALSLTLASVMLLGMMVVGAGAAGFPDVDEDNANIEAIEVLQAVEVMIGDDNGNFGPNDPVNRSQMAVVMAKLLNLDYQYYEASCPFWDVPTWARPYVGACYANKIVSGYGDGTYGAADGVTPVQAASMMMRALGYFQHSEDYQDGFETATVRQGTEVGIFEGVGSSATANMTRAQVARMALNALESEMVTFTGVPGTTYTTSTGEQLSIGYRAEYTPRTSTELKYKAIEDRTSDASLDSNHRGQYYIQLGEELYNGKLVKKFDRDIFERPSINWQYDGKEIGIYVDYDLKVAEYLSAVKYNTLYDELTYTTIRDNDVLRFVDGKETTPFSKDNFARSNKNDLESSGTGVLTEVFHDQQNKEITITSINTYLAQANNDYNTTNESLSMKVYDSKTGTTKIVDSTDVPAAANVKKDEYRLVYMSAKENPSYEVVRMFDVEVMSDSEVTKWSKDGTKVVSKLTTGGTEYSANVKAFYDKANDVFEDYDYQLLTDITYNIYLDRYGNVIGVDEAEGVRNYVFITGYDRGKSHIATKTADANAIFLDGTMDVITVNVTDTNKNISNTKLNMGTYDVWNVQDGKVNENRWYTFTQSANGNYTLKPVARSIYTAYTSDDLGTDGVKTLNTANLYLDDSHVGTKYDSTAAYERQGRIYGNDDSIYITVEPGRVDLSCNVPSHDVNSSTNTSIDNVKDAITDVAGVYTGAQNVKIDLSLETKQEINRDGHYDEDGKEINNGDCETGHEEHGDTNYKSSNERNAYVYSIYDSNYYVIASVVLGEAQGGAANYVYVLDGAKNERVERASSSKSSNGDTYYWEFEAVVDGEITTLTVKEKYSDTLKSNLKIHSLQEIRFDGDYVTAIKDIPVNDVFINYQGADTAKVPEKVKTDDMDVYDVGYVYNQDEWKTVGDYMDGDGKPTKSNESTKMAEMRDIFSDYRWTTAQRAGRIDGTIQLVGRTLYTDRANGDVGLALNTNAKAVLIQPENGKRVATNCGSVSEAIGRLADRYPDETANPGIQFQGRIAAVLDSNGAAKWVVIISDTNLRTGNNPDYGYNGRTYYLDLSGELFSGYSNSTSVWSSAENNNRGGYVEGYNLNSNTSGWGNTTRYEVRSGSTVVVRNYYTDAQMNWYFNNVYMDDIMEWNGRDGYTFVMPSENVAIEGRHNMQYTNNIAGFTSEKIGNGTNVTFDGKSAGVDLGAGVNKVNVKITMPGRSVSSLENGKWYTVTIGEYQENVDVRCVDNALSFEYTVTARDRNAKRIMVWDINLAKNQSGTPVDPDMFAITVEKVGNGTVRVPDSAAEGATVTVTATPAEGYKLVSISVKDASGNDVTVTDGKFTMPAADVTVTVTFKTELAGDEVTAKAVWTGNNNSEGTYALIDAETGKTIEGNAKKGQTIVLNYYEALEITEGAESAGTVTLDGKTVPAWKVTGDITVSNKSGYNWRFGTWLDATWSETPPLAGFAGMFLKARAAVSGAGFLQDVRENGNTYYIEITMENGDKVVVSVSRNEAGGIWFRPYKPSEFDMETAMDRTGTADAYQVWSEESDVGGGSEADDRCQAVIANDGQITINVYEGFEPTEGQIKAAIAKAAGKDLTSEDVVFGEENAVTIDGETGFTLVAEQGTLYKVTVDKTLVTYAAPSGKIPNLPETVTALLPADKLVGVAADVIDDGELPSTVDADVEYVSALKLWNSSVASTGTAYYADGKATGYTEITDITTQKWIQVGVPMMFRLTGEPNAIAGVKVNGKEYTGTVDAYGNLEVVVNDVNGYLENGTAIKLEAFTGSSTVTVKVNGTQVATEVKADDVITLDTPVAGTLIAGKHITSSGAKATALPGSEYKKIQITQTLIDAAVDGVLDLNNAYTLAGYQFDSNAFTLSGVDEEGDALTLAAGDLIAEDYELTLTAEAVATTAKVKAGSKYTLGAPAWNEDGKAVYTIKVTADIADGEFVKDLAVTIPANNAANLVAVENGQTEAEVAAKATATGNVEVTVTGINAKTPVSAKWSLMGGDSALKGLTIKSTIGTGKVTFTFVNETAEAITLTAGSGATTGRMVVDINGISFTVDLTVTAAT